jgi:hypothetical protein
MWILVAILIALVAVFVLRSWERRDEYAGKASTRNAELLSRAKAGEFD